MWQRFTERAHKIIFYAQEEAGKMGQEYVAPEHLMLGITRIPDCMGMVLLGQFDITVDSVREELAKDLERGNSKPGRDMQLTPRAKRVIDLAYDEARHLQHNYIGAEHLLLGLIREGESVVARSLGRMGVTLEAAQEQLQLLLEKGLLPDALSKPRTGLENFAARLSGVKGADDKTSEELLSLDEAVKFLGTSKPTLYRLLGQDEIKGLKVGRQWRFRKVDLIAYMERSPVAFAAAPTEDLDRALALVAGQLGQEPPEGDAESKTAALAVSLMQLAISLRASDIHLEPTPDDLLLRFRVDGVLQEMMRLPLSMKESVTAQYKTMAEMTLSETRLPQDGRIPLKYLGKDFDMRLATLPSLNGEALTMRILDRSTVLVGLEKLGLTPEDRQQIHDLIRLPTGIVLATGPTNSGKTTLLYSCLQAIASVEKKTLTIEDPVEYQMPFLTQTQVNKKAGLTVAAGLRAFLRQDPDVIMVSEMRDLETVQIAMEASLTGHLIFASLYTGDAPLALLRLLELGAEPHLIAATVSGVIATRLIRKVCDNCKRPVELSSAPTLSTIVQLAAEGGCTVPEGTVFVQGAGCEQCRGRGYRGRMGLYEVLTMTETLAEAVLRRAPVEELTDIAVAGGMRTLLADGIGKAAAGETTIEEVLRVVSVSLSANIG